MAQTKHIDTRRVRFWRMVDTLAFVLPALRSVRGFANALAVSPQAGQGMAAYLAYVVVSYFGVAVVSVMLVHAVTRPLRNTAQQNASFESVQDLEYFRDRLGSLTPGEISMISDLALEPAKDITASLLQLKLHKVVDISGGRAYILNEDDPSVTLADRVILRTLRENDGLVSSLGTCLTEWELVARQQIVGGPYVVEASSPKASPKADEKGGPGFAKGCLVPILVYCALMGVVYLAPTLRHAWDVLLANSDATYTAEFACLFANDATLCVGAVIMAPLLVVACAVGYRPLCYLVELVVSAKSKSPYARTQLGEQCMEYIYGVKNYLRDFTALSEADQYHLILWDDFLVYAVVLEENEAIVQDILQRRGIDWASLKL